MADTKAEALTEAKTTYNLLAFTPKHKGEMEISDYTLIPLPELEYFDEEPRPVDMFEGCIEMDKGGVNSNADIFYSSSDLADIYDNISTILDASIVNEKQKDGLKTLIFQAFERKKHDRRERFWNAWDKYLE